MLGGRAVSSGRETRAIHDPATGETLGHLPLATPADVDDALAAADAAFPAWKKLTPARRGNILRSAAQLLRQRIEAIALCLTLEQGKPLRESRAEITTAADTLDWFAEEGRRAYGRVIPGRHDGSRYLVLKEPVGPVASLAPWNFPATNAARKIGSALAAGCTCVHKPAEEAPASAHAVGQALLDAGLPAGVLSIVYGEPGEIAHQLVSSPLVRKLSFTGSVPVGRDLMCLAARHGKRTTMELGGHAPVVVFNDVDLDAVLDLAVARKFSNAGQICVSPTRFYVHEALHTRFVQGFVERTRALRVGHGRESDTDMGPLAHERRPTSVAALVEDAREHGADVMCGGSRRNGPGWYYEPTVLANVPETARVMNEEPFGPIALINAFDSMDAAVSMANRLPLGLSAYVFAESRRICEHMADAMETGMLGINTFRISLPDTPFVGIKDSGHGAENGVEGLEACLVTKVVAQA